MSAVLSAVSLSTIARTPVFELLIRVPWGASGIGNLRVLRDFQCLFFGCLPILFHSRECWRRFWRHFIGLLEWVFIPCTSKVCRHHLMVMLQCRCHIMPKPLSDYLHSKSITTNIIGRRQSKVPERVWENRNSRPIADAVKGRAEVFILRSQSCPVDDVLVFDPVTSKCWASAVSTLGKRAIVRWCLSYRLLLGEITRVVSWEQLVFPFFNMYGLRACCRRSLRDFSRFRKCFFSCDFRSIFWS